MIQRLKVTDKGFFFSSSYLLQSIMFGLLTLAVVGATFHFWTEIYTHPGLLKYGVVVIVFLLVHSMFATGKKHMSGEVYMHWGADQETVFFENDSVIGTEKIAWSRVNRCFLIRRLSGRESSYIKNVVVLDVELPVEGFKRYRACSLLNFTNTSGDYFRVLHSGAGIETMKALLEKFGPEQLDVFEIDKVSHLKDLDKYTPDGS